MDRIKVENVHKKFTLNYVRSESALFRILSMFNKDNKKEFNVLNGISFSVKEGEVLGITGKNGSGKSTLLRAIAGIYEIDSGKIKCNGKVVYLSGLMTGLHEKLTLRENVYLMGSILGLSQKDIRKKFNSIVEFSELNDFVDVKLSQFSSGMILRLAFSITIFCVSHTNPDILLLDEVFGAGGDESFKRKSILKMEELIRGGVSVVIVSHQIDILKKYCDRLLLMDGGKIIKEGKPEEVIESYVKDIN